MSNYTNYTYISEEEERELLRDVIGRVEEVVLSLEDFDPLRTLVINVGPDYSSILAMRLCHALSKDGESSHLVGIDLAYPDDDSNKKESYLKLAEGLLAIYASTFSKIVLVEAAVLTGNTFRKFVDILTSKGFSKESLHTVSLVERNDSVFKCDIVGRHVETTPEFWWEKPNKHWD